MANGAFGPGPQGRCLVSGGKQPKPCQLPQKIRIFKVVHIIDMQVLDEHFDRSDDFDLPGFWNEATARFEAELRSNTVHQRVSATGLDRISKLGAFAAQAVEAQRDTIVNAPD